LLNDLSVACSNLTYRIGWTASIDPISAQRGRSATASALRPD
jgi:hypothetical protein